MSATITIDRSKLYGVLHEPSGRRIVRQVRVLKVGIGVPTGPDVHVWIDQNHQWCIEIGTYVNGKRVHRGELKSGDRLRVGRVEMIIERQG